MMMATAAGGLTTPDLVGLLSGAPPIVVLVVVVFMFLRFIREREEHARARDEQFLGAMRDMVAEVRALTGRTEDVSREMVQVMGQATEALRRLDHDLNARNP
jgi:hypothetical protein